jgi:hypothetical protein
MLMECAIAIAVIFGLTIVFSILRMYASGKVRTALKDDPTINAMLKSVEDVGRYDGSAESKRKAQAEFDDMAMFTGCINQYTEQLYWKTLEQTNLVIPLAVWYSFAVGEYIKSMPPQLLAEMRSEAKTPAAEKNQKVIIALFPGYTDFVMQRHSYGDSGVILGLTSNFMNSYIRRKRPDLAASFYEN